MTIFGMPLSRLGADTEQGVLRISITVIVVFAVLGIVGLIAGLFSFGYVEELTGNMRISTLILGSYFILGLFLLIGLQGAAYRATSRPPALD